MDILFVISGEDGSLLRFRQHGRRLPERLPALPPEGDLSPATETVPAPSLPQRSHQVCVLLNVWLSVCVCVCAHLIHHNLLLFSEAGDH